MNINLLNETIQKINSRNINGILEEIWKDDSLFSSNRILVTLFMYLIKEIESLKDSQKDAQETIKNLKQRITLLEDRKLQKPGRKRKVFYVNGQELDDNELVYLIDYDFFTIRKLEKEVGAHKNQLRARYKRAKQKQQIAKGRE